ncbi:BMC domain-containing protein [Calidifontibacillus erzurumensis]|uniref:BMC domain-containing protein n=1 Tax=Calidifontibacillus erzurumensis TaxID=2741433 RepID=A0A8J8K7S1_9BACI|nr:BMC domain-containing protein [Calidifontibacillus erzurumensis]NSL51036.1 BMC domain-containing protein [Calidifontibacillus erzurumensis]
MTKALGMIETKGLVATIEAADAMLKAADVTLIRKEKVDAGLVAILIEGDVSAVQAAVEAGKKASNRFGTYVSSWVIPHPDKQIKELIQKNDGTNITDREQINIKDQEKRKNNKKMKDIKSDREKTGRKIVERKEENPLNIPDDVLKSSNTNSENDGDPSNGEMEKNK